MTSAGIQVVPNAADNFAFSAIPSPQVAGVPFTVTIRATDTSGNTVYDYTGDAVLGSNTGTGTSTPAQITFVAGVWSGPVTLFGCRFASVRLTCTDFSSPPRTGTSVNITVNPASFTKLQVILPGETAKRWHGRRQRSARRTPRWRARPSHHRLRAVDAYWNVVSGIGDRIALTSTDEFAGIPAETDARERPARLPRNALQEWNADDHGARRRQLVDRGQHVRPSVNIVGGAFSRVLVLAPGESPAPGTATGRTGAAIDQSINYAFTSHRARRPTSGGTRSPGPRTSCTSPAPIRCRRCRRIRRW